MSCSALADPTLTIPVPPRVTARMRAPVPDWRSRAALLEALLVGSIALPVACGLAELALLLDL